MGRLTAMAKTTGQFILERLADEWGVRRIYGYPGDGINGILGAFHHVGDRLEFTQVRHEEIAAFAACEARELAHALAEGDPNAPRLVRQSLRGKLAEFLTR